MSIILLRGEGSHVTITHDTLDLTIQGPSRHGTSLPLSPRHVHLFIMKFIMKHVRLASGWFATYWNAFFFYLQLSNHLRSAPQF